MFHMEIVLKDKMKIKDKIILQTVVYTGIFIYGNVIRLSKV